MDGLEKKLAIGTYPDVSFSEARKPRDDARELLAGGKNPSREKQRDKVRDRLQADNTSTGRQATLILRPSMLPSVLH